MEQQTKEYYQWVKASENIPLNIERVFIRNIQTKAGCMILTSELAKMDGLENVEWLAQASSESPTSTDTGQGECKKCNGSGMINEPNKPEKHECEFCDGTGRTEELTREGWTSVKNRLPEHRQGWSNSLDVNILISKEGDEWVSTGSYSYQLKKWCDYLYGETTIENIIAWMPLPAIVTPQPVTREGEVTAMGELRNKLQVVEDFSDGTPNPYNQGYKEAMISVVKDIEAQLLAKEREQIMKAWVDGNRNDEGMETSYAISDESYFNKKYKQQ